MRRTVAIVLAILIFITGNGFIRNPIINVTDQEREWLARIVMAEASGEDLKGKALIARVVINRLYDGGYGDSIEAVIFATGQFYTAGMYQEPTKECYIAVDMVLNGWDEAQGALYFCATGYNGAVPLFQHGGHYFSTKKGDKHGRCERGVRLILEEVS